jgi:hypothetical protein
VEVSGPMHLLVQTLGRSVPFTGRGSIVLVLNVYLPGARKMMMHTSNSSPIQQRMPRSKVGGRSKVVVQEMLSIHRSHMQYFRMMRIQRFNNSSKRTLRPLSNQIQLVSARRYSSFASSIFY